MTRHCLRRGLRLLRLEERVTPAELLHSLFPETTGPQRNASFGNSVATGATFRVVGAPHSAVFGLNRVGQAFVYDVASNNLIATLNNPMPGEYDFFGTSVAVSGKYVVVGAQSDDTGAVNGGSAFVYDLTSMTPTAPIATLNNPTPAESEFFGTSVAVFGDFVTVGAYADNTGASDAGSVYVYDLSSMTPTTPIVTLNNPMPAGGDHFGISVAMAGNYIVVGAYQDDAGANDAGSAYVYDLSSTTPSAPIATLDNPGPAVGDYFGYLVAVSGKYVVVGAYQDDTGATDAGSAYVYDLTSMTPTTPIASLNNPTPASTDYFGQSVAASGKYVAVGTAYDDTPWTNTGSTYVYDLCSMTPTIPITVLKGSSPGLADHFGSAVAVSGNDVVVGVPDVEAGSAFVFDLSSMTPTAPIAILDNPTPAASDRFGYSVALSGNYMVVGAPYVGSASVYDVNSLTPTTPIITVNHPLPAAGEFGNSVAVSGKYVVVGAPYDNTGASDAGLAYVYDLNSMTPTTPIAILNNPTPSAADNFGISVAASGKYVVVGAHRDNTGASDAGTAYVYYLSSPTPTTPVATLNNPAPAVSDFFGISVAVSGKYVVVGAYGDNTGATDAGSAYVYDLNLITSATPIASLNNPMAAVGDYFAISIAVAGNYVVVGAPNDDAGATDAGSVYVYDLNLITPTTPIATLNNPVPAASDLFGISVAASSKYVVVGEYQDDTGATDAGSAYVYDLTSMTPQTPIATLNHPTPAESDNFGISVAVSGNNVVIGAELDDDQNHNQGSARVYTLAHARVANLQINAGDSQRSRVTSLAVTFDQPVSFSTLPAAAFALKRQSDDAKVNISAAVSGNTVTLNFIDGAVEFGSLADGRYTLTIDANQVFNSNGKLDGDGNGTAGGNYVLFGSPANGLFRLFGDADGSGVVNAADFVAFRTAFGGSSNIFDFDNDGSVSNADFVQFRVRFGSMI